MADHSVKDVAGLSVSVARSASGFLEARCVASLPGVDPHERTFYAHLGEFDEVTNLMADFHNEWRAWGSLLDCVLDDWAPQVRSLF